MAIVQIIILVSIFGGYDVIVTVEEFVENEITVVDETVAQKAGDNILICDAVMQAIFVARLMDYPENVEDNFEDRILKAFWSIDICWSEDGLLKAQESGDFPKVQWWLKTIWKRLQVLDKKVEV